MPNHRSPTLQLRVRNIPTIHGTKIIMSEDKSPHLMLIGTPPPIELSHKKLAMQDCKLKAKTPLSFRPTDVIPLNQALFRRIQITTLEKLMRQSIKILKDIHRSSLNKTLVNRKSLKHRLEESNMSSNREPSMSPMIDLLM